MFSLARTFDAVKCDDEKSDERSGTIRTISLSEQGQRANDLALQKINAVWTQYLGRGVTPR